MIAEKPRFRAPRGPAWILAATLALLVAAMLLLPPAFIALTTGQGQCDGNVPRWMLPDNYQSLGGCVTLRPAWEGWLPWNWGRQDLVCLGMCAPEDSLTRP